MGIRTDVTELKRIEEALAGQSAILEAVLENLDQGVSMVDKDLNLLACNNSFFEILEFPTDRFGIGSNIAEFFRYNAERGEYGEGDIEQQVQERVDLAMKFEAHRFERSRGDGMVIEVRGIPVPTGGFVSTYTDITERKRAEEVLSDQLKFTEALVDTIPNPISVKSAERRYLTFNRAFEKAFGIRREDYIGKTVMALKHVPLAMRERLDR